MRSLLLLLAVGSIGATVFCARRARAGDFYVETVTTGVDAGVSAVTLSSNAARYQGNEIAIRCTSDARLKHCNTTDNLNSPITSCVASGAHGQYLDSTKTFPICVPTGWGFMAIAAVDGGVAACDFAVVNPRQTCQQQ